MRVLFVASASISHLAPMVPLAWGLRGAGHDVVVACDPGIAVGVAGYGLTVAAVGPDARFGPRHRALSDPCRRPRGADTVELFARSAELMVDDLVELGLRWRPDLVVHDPVAFAAEIAAHRLAVPAARHLWGPDVLATDEGRWLASGVRELLSPARDRHGVHADLHADGEPVVVDPTPAALQLPDARRRIRCRFVAVDRPGTVPADIVGAAPSPTRLCVTWGTSAAGRARSHLLVRALPRIAEAASEVLLAVSSDDLTEFGGLPVNVRPVVGAPLHRLLPACRAVVHHGGAGTLLGSAVAGLPQLVVSDDFEPAFNGDRLVRAGAGRHLAAATSDGDSVADAAAELLADPDLFEAAQRLRHAAEADPTPLELAQRLPELTGVAARGRAEGPAR